MSGRPLPRGDGAAFLAEREAWARFKAEVVHAYGGHGGGWMVSSERISELGRAWRAARDALDRAKRGG